MNQSQLEYDLLVIGGGINGAGIAADAAGRGLSVVLCEKSDLAAATSSASSKLIHGGLRYLEQYEFGLVRSSLNEREVLINAAQHIVRPLPFHIPLLPHSRGGLLLRAGLFLYDNLGQRRRFRGSRAIRINPKESPLNAAITRGFEYWDAQVDDARLVVLNALQAREQGARILTRTEVTAITTIEEGFEVTLHNHHDQRESSLRVKGIVNATGPWAASVKNILHEGRDPLKLRLLRGSHIVVPRLHDGIQAYLLQHHDGRVIFVIPYQREYSLIGTTESEFQGNPDDAEISEEEIHYLISVVNLYFKKSIQESDVVRTFAGVRPLIDDGEKTASKVSREFEIRLEHSPQPFLSVYGGKLTTYRLLAEATLNQLSRFYPRMKPAWTRRARLPGGDFDLPENLFKEIATRYAWLGPDLITRWQHNYGTLVFKMLGDARSMPDLGVNFGQGLYKREVDYLQRHEWAHTADDILWRRTKLGYRFSKKEAHSLSNYMEQTSAVRR
ncbi:MAG: glycerol-3-phosphate dehydrogenase [Gammaproteobacteria bacterium]